VPFDPPRQGKLDQRDLHGPAGPTHDRVDVHRRGAERPHDAAAVAVREVRRVLVARPWLSGAGPSSRSCIAGRLVSGVRADKRSLASVTSRTRLQKLVGALRARVERVARHREHLAALLGGKSRGDELA